MYDVIVPLDQEGTTAKIHQWYIQPGQKISKNEPLVELETDKVTVEVPSPVTGTVVEVLIQPGSEAKAGQILARIDTSEQTTADSKKIAVQTQTLTQAQTTAHRHSPAVRKALAETGLDPNLIAGTGRDGRLTRDDVLSAARTAPPHTTSSDYKTPSIGSSIFVPHDNMRLAIARNMLASVTQAPQVTAIVEADFSTIVAHRAKHKASFAEDGINLSYTAYIIMACISAMRAVPQVNSRWHDDKLEIFRDINIGIGTALGDKGLVVPVIRQAQNKSLKGVAATLQDQTNRARSGQLTSADMKGGTFTISNHGISGSILAAPVIINQPQSAILGVGKLEKRVIVREIDGNDTIQIRPMAYISLTIDHRALDGHQTNRWLTAFKAALEASEF